jgi:hypothetical protein
VLLGQNFTELSDIEYAKSSGVFKFSQKGCYNVLAVDKTVVQVGHFGFDKTFELISEKYWFPKIRRFTKKYVDNCLNCLYFKSTSSQKSGFLYPIKKVPKPFHTIHIDHLGPFIRSKSGKTQVFTVIDAFTKFIFLYAVKSTKAIYAITMPERTN